MLDDWQRLEKIIDWTGLSVNAFARGVGLKRAENLYQIKKGNNGISKDLATLVAARYPTVNRAWLLTGDGDPFIGPPGTETRGSIAFYNHDAVLVAHSPREFTPAEQMAVGIFSGAEFAAINHDAAMAPRIPEGATVFMQRINSKRIMPGRIYLVISPEFKGIRIVRRDKADSPLLRLVPANTADHDEVQIDAESVQNLWVVLGYLARL